MVLRLSFYFPGELLYPSKLPQGLLNLESRKECMDSAGLMLLQTSCIITCWDLQRGPAFLWLSIAAAVVEMLYQGRKCSRASRLSLRHFSVLPKPTGDQSCRLRWTSNMYNSMKEAEPWFDILVVVSALNSAPFSGISGKWSGPFTPRTKELISLTALSGLGGGRGFDRCRFSPWQLLACAVHPLISSVCASRAAYSCWM